MRVIVKTKNLELTEQLRNFVEEKFIALKKFINILKKDIPEKGKTLAEVFVEVEKETTHHRKGQIFGAKVAVLLPGKKLMAQAKDENLNRAIIKTREELKKEIKKYKGKIIATKDRRARKMKREINR